MHIDVFFDLLSGILFLASVSCDSRWLPCDSNTRQKDILKDISRTTHPIKLKFGEYIWYTKTKDLD